MTKKLLEIIRYILSNYPYPDEISASRLTKMVYLADWKEAIVHGKQITEIKWHFNHRGPYNDEIIQAARKDKNIKITVKNNIFGNKKTHIELIGCELPGNIDSDFLEVLDFVINATKEKSYGDFLKLVYSTYPVISSDKYDDLDLVSKAAEYKSMT